MKGNETRVGHFAELETVPFFIDSGVSHFLKLRCLGINSEFHEYYTGNIHNRNVKATEVLYLNSNINNLVTLEGNLVTYRNKIT